MSQFDIKSHCIDGQHKREYRQGAVSERAITRIQIKQYITHQSSSQHGATIIAAGGNGFPKEAYEPFFEDLCLEMENLGQHVSQIWIADIYTQGASGLKNSSVHGNDPSWWDHSRDLLHMINVFRCEMQEPLIGVGHSIGAAQIAYLSTLHPRLFTTLVLIEPQIHDGVDQALALTLWQAVGRRRESWPSRVDAEKSIRKSPFYANWDSRALDRLVKFSLIEDGDKTWTTTARDTEVAMLGRLNLDGVGRAESPRKSVEVTEDVPDLDPSVGGTYPFYRAESTAMYKLLPSVRPSCLFVCSARSPSSRPEFRDRWLNSTGTGVGGSGGASAGRVAMEVFSGDRHALPMDDKLSEVAQITARWIASEGRRWRQQDAEFQKMWEQKTLSEKQALHPLTRSIIQKYRGDEPLEDFARKIRATSKL